MPDTKTRPPYHRHQVKANQVLLWSGTDLEQTFKQNCENKQHRQRLEQHGWLPYQPIEYRYNSQGFRDREFDNTPSILALGCSHTEGVGLHQHQTWPCQLSQQLDHCVWNLGIGACSLDTCFRLLDYWINHLQVRAVVVLVPHKFRVEMVMHQGHVESCGPWSVDQHFGEFYKLWIDHTDNADLNQRKNMLAMQCLCLERDIPILFCPSSDLRDTKDGASARDLMHYGAKTHADFAHSVANQLKELL